MTDATATHAQLAGTELAKAMAAMEAMGVRDRMKLVGLLTFIDDIHEMGLDEAQGLLLADSWFWTRDEDSRRWAERFFAARQRMPSSLHAADYSAATQFLRAVAATGTSDSSATIGWLRSSTTTCMCAAVGSETTAPCSMLFTSCRSRRRNRQAASGTCMI